MALHLCYCTTVDLGITSTLLINRASSSSKADSSNNSGTRTRLMQVTNCNATTIQDQTVVMSQEGVPLSPT